MTRLAGAVVLVTGAGRGIGRRIALGAAARGATVVLWDVRGAAAEAVRGELEATGSVRVLAQQVDVTDRDAVYAAAKETQAEVGPVDVIVHNAGVVTGTPFLDATDDGVDRTFGVNTLALYWVTRAFLPAMVERRAGHVVTIASAAGLLGVARQTDYAASKHAAVGFNDSLRAELRRWSPAVRTTLVCPFYVNTGMFAGVRSRVPWLLPILEEAEVAEKVLAAVEHDRQRLFLPPVVRLVPALQVLPTGLFDRMMDLLGVNASMDHFRPD